MAARILCCPEEEIAISGVQPANSILISVVIPKLYVLILVKFLQDRNRKHYFAQLAKLGVDHFIVSGKMYVLHVQNQGILFSSKLFKLSKLLLDTLVKLPFKFVPL